MNKQKRRSDERKATKDGKKGKDEKEKDDSIDEEVNAVWKEEWEGKRNHMFDEDWLPRYWLIFLLKGKVAPAKDRCVTGSALVTEIQLSTSCKSKRVLPKEAELQALAIQKTYKRQEEDEDAFLGDFKNPRLRAESGTSSSAFFQLSLLF